MSTWLIYFEYIYTTLMIRQNSKGMAIIRSIRNNDQCCFYDQIFVLSRHARQTELDIYSSSNHVS